MTYGAAVTDVTGDGYFEVVVATYSGSNLILSYDHKIHALKNIAVTGSPHEAVMDPEGHAVGVAACDVDGDGREEIYILNSNSDIKKRENHGDKLFKYVDNRFVDLLSNSVNSWIREVAHVGHSVTCIDRKGTGLYAFAVMTSMLNGTERFLLIEMDKSHPDNNIISGPIVFRDVAKDAGIDMATSGRGIAIGPILGTDGRSDIFVNVDGDQNKNGENKLFMNIGEGKFRNVARQLGLTDENQRGRDVVLGDINQDGLMDIVAGNWLGSHRLFIQQVTSYSQNVKFIDMATSKMQDSSALCSLAMADFDNDGHSEILFNNALYYKPGPNRLFRVNITTTSAERQDLNITKIDIGEALEPRAYSTGSVVTDIDRDGVLDILITHGESISHSMTAYSARSKKRTRGDLASNGSTINSKVMLLNNYTRNMFGNESLSLPRNENFWVRIIPKTRFEAPARGAKVTLVLAGGKWMTQVIGVGSGYRGQMEPVAHFGIGRKTDVLLLEVQWPDGRVYQKTMGVEDVNRVHDIPWSSLYKETSIFPSKNVDKNLRRRTGSAGRVNTSIGFVLLVHISVGIVLFYM
ncbi:cartilage acidic protein 1-like [Pecten maximus]|uniref:cartilage acidic protein 1-like n=1 Tax=Pecten maximus TaxID=6579 RepID=UPI001458336E|nr:cartilage acidic protein 1-like [Pecten maximus]